MLTRKHLEAYILESLKMKGTTLTNLILQRQKRRKAMFERGNQIAYIPDHAEKDIRHKDVEFGFVTSVSKTFDIAFCRFWSKSNPDELRTKANSEGCYVRNLILCHLKPYEVILKALEEIDKADLFGG